MSVLVTTVVAGMLAYVFTFECIKIK
jgi:hypothetical protein